MSVSAVMITTHYIPATIVFDMTISADMAVICTDLLGPEAEVSISMEVVK